MPTILSYLPLNKANCVVNPLGSILDEIVAETTLIAGFNTGVALYDPYAVIIVSVIDASGCNHSSYVIDFSLRS